MGIVLEIKKLIYEILYKNWAMQTKIISAAMLNNETFGPYKNLCNGERDVVICGAGPSLQKYQPIEGAIHIALNRAFLFDKIKFDYIFAQDFDGIKMVMKELEDYDEACVKLFGLSDGGSKEIPESYAIKCKAKRFATDSYLYHNGYRSECVADIDRRAIGGMPNVGMSVMQWALFMNPRKLYIVGCDMSGNHFTTGNQTEEEVKRQAMELEKEWREHTVLLLEKWKEIKRFAETYYPDTDIISVNPVGLKGLFEDLYQ